ncbi:MAG TPA: hypothetical protein EYP60_06135 [bacterium (Candidatus Stahlbacteria)]|nr:hypothetical protein [Candidatus Stahlbacteria bacterium]
MNDEPLGGTGFRKSAIQLHSVNLFQYTKPEIKAIVDDYMQSIIDEMKAIFTGYQKMISRVHFYLT